MNTSEVRCVVVPFTSAKRHLRVWRPATRADCAAVARPCPYVGCEHNLYLDVSVRTGHIKLNFPDVEPGEMRDSCALDVAEREKDGASLRVVASALNVTHERVRQIETIALKKLLPVVGALR